MKSLWRLFSRRRRYNDISVSIQEHVNEMTEELMEEGLSYEEAQSAARKKFGNVTLLEERSREVWQWGWLETLWMDLRYTSRQLRKSPGFTFAAILVMALGIGANVALFTLVRSVLLKPLPYQDPERLALIYENDLHRAFDSTFRSRWLPVDAGSFAEWKQAAQSLAEMSLISPFQSYNLSSEGGKLPEQVDAAWVNDNFFSMLGVRPALGRAFTSDDDNPQAPAAVVLSNSLWRRRYASDRSILGKTILLNATPYTVIGVLPADFVYSGAFGGNTVQVWTPVKHEAPAWLLRAYNDHEFQVVAKLKPQVSLATLQERLIGVQQQIKASHPHPAVHDSINSRSMLDDAVHEYKTPLYALLAATACVLLIACMNVASLLVARAAARKKEFAIREALGGGRLRLIRERLVESLLLSSAGGCIGVLLAWGSLRWLIHSLPDMHRIEAIQLDAVIVTFTVAVIALCAVASGVIASLGIGQYGNILSGLQENSRAQGGGRSRARLRRVLLVTEISLTVVLLVGAGLLLKSFNRLRSTDLGVPLDTLTLRFDLPDTRYNTPEKRVAFFEQLIARVRALPGVSSAGLVSSAPGQGWNGDDLMSIVEHPPLAPGQGMDFQTRGADPDYFRAIGIPLLSGRSFQANERLERSDVALISKSAAEQYFPGEDPIGKHIRRITNEKTWEVIGVVGDVRWRVTEPPHPIIYRPLYGNGYGSATIIVRSQQNVEALAVPVQKVVGQLDADLPVANVMTLRETIGKSTLNAALESILVLAFACIALVLATAGLYGVLAYLVTQRTSEFGIRIALGAQRRHVLQNVLFDGLRPALIGLTLGLIASAGAVQLIRSMLYQTEEYDPTIFSAVAGILFCVAVAACLAPAWRAARLNPMRALRTE